MGDTTYNGWSNYQTWNANLWLSNDEPVYRIAWERTEGVTDAHRAGVILRTVWRTFLSESAKAEAKPSRFINWDEIGEAWLER